VSRLRGRITGERVARGALRAIATIPLAALAVLVVVLMVRALPAIRYNGLGFFVHDAWRPGSFYADPVTTGGISHPPGVSYGALPLIVGTIESSLLAMALAVPVGIGTAMIVVEKLPARLSSGAGFFLEVLAGVPSVVYGLWGALTLGPWLANHVAPLIADHAPDVPVLRFFGGTTGAGEGLFTAGAVLAIMILPIIAATTRDLLRQVPRQTVEGALALGLTDAESMRAVSFPWVRTGVLGAAVLGLGRALGETMALAMVSGTVLGAVPRNFYDTFTTIAATIVSQLDSSLTDGTGFAMHTMAELALVLLAITLFVNVVARLIIRRVSTTALPVGRGV
jgi:phosphate transport system permease protein